VGLLALLAITLPSLSSVFVASPSFIINVYAFIPEVTYGTVFVASPNAMANNPVASGSRVPAWPAFFCV